MLMIFEKVGEQNGCLCVWGGKLHKVVNKKGVALERVQCFNFVGGGSVLCHHFEDVPHSKKRSKRWTGRGKWAEGKHGLQAQLSGPPSEGGEDGESCGG